MSPAASSHGKDIVKNPNLLMKVFESSQQMIPVIGKATTIATISILMLSPISVFRSCENVEPMDFKIANCFFLDTMRPDIEL